MEQYANDIESKSLKMIRIYLIINEYNLAKK